MGRRIFLIDFLEIKNNEVIKKAGKGNERKVDTRSRGVAIAVHVRTTVSTGNDYSLKKKIDGILCSQHFAPAISNEYIRPLY